VAPSTASASGEGVQDAPAVPVAQSGHSADALVKVVARGMAVAAETVAADLDDALRAECEFCGARPVPECPWCDGSGVQGE
jgi:hypothetical protein